MAITIGSGIVFEAGVEITPSYNIVTTGLELYLDAGDPTSYPGSGSTWTDLVSAKAFTLYGGVTYNGGNGGYLTFDPASSQYAEATSLSSLSTWTVEAWHYYTGTNSGASPCIVTELFPGSTSNINYTLGSVADNNPNLSAAFFDGAWQATANGYTLTANAWYQVVGTYDGATVKLYVNNSLINSTSYSGTPISSGGGIRLMRRWDLGQYWGGSLGIVRMYNTDIGAGGIAQNYNANRSRFGL